MSVLARAKCEWCGKDVAVRPEGTFGYHKRKSRIRPWTSAICPGFKEKAPKEASRG